MNNSQPEIRKDLYTLITGGSSGLGKSLAMQMAARGHNLVLVALAGEGLDLVKYLIESEHKVKVAIYECDLTKLEELKKLSSWVKQNYEINVLINNVGLGAACSYTSTEFDFIDKMIKLNMRAVSFLTHQLIPMLRRNRSSYILNIASILSYYPSGYKSVYPASKAFVYHFSLGMAEELRGKGIHVSVLNPGPMKTNQTLINRIKNHGFFVKASIVPVDRVAAIAIRDMFKLKRVIVVGWVNHFALILMQIIPKKIGIRWVSLSTKKEIIKDIRSNSRSSVI